MGWADFDDATRAVLFGFLRKTQGRATRDARGPADLEAAFRSPAAQSEAFRA